MRGAAHRAVWSCWCHGFSSTGTTSSWLAVMRVQVSVADGAGCSVQLQCFCIGVKLAQVS